MTRNNLFRKEYIWAGLVITIGLALRLVVYWQNRALFLDEANLALNIAERNLFDFFRTLDHDQYAPPIFMILTKFNTILAGYGEQVLRIWPLLSGISLLVVLYWIGRNYFADKNARSLLAFGASLLLLLLIALSPILIQYSTEFKQYIWDAFWAALTIGLALNYPLNTRRSWLFWLALGIALPWLSMPMVFVLAAIGFYFLLSRHQAFEKQFILPWLAMVGAWLLSFGLYYYFILASDLARTDLNAYHSPYFFPLLPQNSSDWVQAGHLLLSPFRGLMGHTVLAYITGVGLTLAGIVSLWRNKKAILVLLLLPMVLAYLASAFGYYSLIPRLILFVYPGLFWLMWQGIDSLVAYSSKWFGPVLILLLAILVPGQKGYRYLDQPLVQEEMRQLLDELPEDASNIYVHSNAQPAVEYYLNYHPDREAWPKVEPDHYLDWGKLPSDESSFIMIYGHVPNAIEWATVNGDLERLQELSYACEVQRGIGVAWLNCNRSN